jgi:hypothetical protein
MEGTQKKTPNIQHRTSNAEVSGGHSCSCSPATPACHVVALVKMEAWAKAGALARARDRRWDLGSGFMGRDGAHPSILEKDCFGGTPKPRPRRACSPEPKVAALRPLPHFGEVGKKRRNFVAHSTPFSRSGQAYNLRKSCRFSFDGITHPPML